GAHRVQQRRTVGGRVEKGLREGLEPLADVARQRRRARDEGDRAHDEAPRREPRAVLVVAGEVPGLDAALVDALARERPAQLGDEARRARVALGIPGLGYGRASSTRLKGVSVARRKRVKPPAVTTSRSLASPACAPSARPTSCASEAGVQIMVEAE